jgi:hypothetical protein
MYPFLLESIKSKIISILSGDKEESRLFTIRTNSSLSISLFLSFFKSFYFISSTSSFIKALFLGSNILFNFILES